MWRSIAALALALFLSGSAWAAEPPLTFGLYPYLTPQKLTTGLSPLRNHLQKALGRDITLVTAPTLSVFMERMRAGDYDLVFAAPHFTRIAERDLGFRRVAMTLYHVQSYVVVPKESPITTPDDLRGKRIATPPRDSMNYLLVMEAFKLANLAPERDLTLREYDTNENALAAPVRGDADAGVTGHLVWQKSGLKDKTRAVITTATVPGFMLMTHPRVPLSTVEQLRAAALSFGATPEGKESLAASGYVGWVPIDDASMQALDRYLRHVPK